MITGVYKCPGRAQNPIKQGKIAERKQPYSNLYQRFCKMSYFPISSGVFKNSTLLVHLIRKIYLPL